MTALTRQMPTVTSHAMRFSWGTERLLSRTRMTLPPDIALAYVKELSADYRNGVILDASHTLLAGDPRLEPLARALLEHGGTSLEGETEQGKVFAECSKTQAIVITTGPFSLSRVVRHDLRRALAAMGAESAQGMPVQRIPHGSVEALLRASD